MYFVFRFDANKVDILKTALNFCPATLDHHMHLEKVKNYNSLIDKIRKSVSDVPTSRLVRSVQNWSNRILSILKTEDA